ncbi:MAG: zinc-dependent metalloprotease [Verrucomicrobiales bacterium]|nr:zinc-dependent metalloprotease [Verrucomicrobiales bacterium]
MDLTIRLSSRGYLSALLFSSALLLFSGLCVSAEDARDKEKEEEKNSIQSIEEVLEDCDTRDGLFPLHQNRKNGKLFLEIGAVQLATEKRQPEFIHFSHTLDGVTELGFFRGQFTRSKIFRIRRHFEKIEFIEENTSFYFRPESALHRAASANISEAILASPSIAAMNADETRFLVEADGVFLKEFFRQLKPGKKKDDKDDEFKLGDLSKDRTRFLESKSFPDNTLFRVQYVFENLHPSKQGEEHVADSRFVTIKVQHTLIAMPENDYEPRFDDPRVGFFTTQVTDLTSKSSAPYRDFIHRWHLKKKNPKAKVSDPVEPITWWIENTTPVELRDTIHDAGLAWNLAFESAGISNAVEVKIQPDDADWDSDDIRYHVLRWTSSPDPPFGGYGPSFVNPRTGQILGADIMLEYVFLTNRIRFREVVNLGGGAERRAFPLGRIEARGHLCEFGSCLHSNRIASGAMLKAQAARFGNGPVDMDALIEQALTDLILHEIGHTLGLNHNFRASHLYNRKDIHNKELTAKTGLTGSVMEYSPINLALDPKEQGHYFSLVPGPYDHWAIRYGYDAKDKLDTILAESTRREHAFANDADDMRSTGRGIDPRAMISDLTSEPIAHAAGQMELVKMTLPKLADQFPVDGESYHELRTAFSSLMREYSWASQTLSRFVGGVQVDRALVGQEGASANPLQPVEADTQKEAMKQLAKHVFGPDAISFSPDLVARLALQRRGFDFFELDDNEDPKIYDRILDLQKAVLDQLLHKHTLARVLDTSLYGNEYELGTMMGDLDAAIMEGDADGRPTPFREALQLNYVERLIKISGLDDKSDYPGPARSEAVALLENHLSRFENFKASRNLLRHRVHVTRLITNALENR